MIKVFLQNSLIYTIGTVLTRGIGIILLPIYTRYLTPSEYGVIDLFMILGSIISLTIALEIFQAVARYYPEAKTKSDKQQYVSTAFIFTLLMYIIYITLSIIYAESLTILLLDDIIYINIFYLATISIFTNGIFYFVLNQLKWQLMPKKSTIVSIIQVFIVGIIVIYLLVIENLKVESIFIGQIIGNIIASIIAIYYAKENYKISFNYKKFIEMTSLSLPLVFSGIAIFLSLYIDRVFIKELLGLEELGVYGLAYRFAAITSLVMIGFQSALIPLVYTHYQEKETPSNISKLFNIFVIFALFVISGSILLSQEVVVLMATKKYYESAPLIAILVMTVFFNNMYIFTPGLGIAKKTKIVMLISFLSAIVNILLNVSLIPFFGLEGAAFATLSSAIVAFILRLILSNKYYKIEYNYTKLMVSFIFVLLLSYITNILLSEINLLNLLLKITILLFMIYVVSYFILGKETINLVLKKIKAKI